jgi:hypothetical protein
MVRGIDFERFLGPPKYFAMLYGLQALQVLETLAQIVKFSSIKVVV